MGIAPAAVVDAPRLQPSRIGLRAQSEPITEPRWHGGIAYRPLTATVPSVANSTADPCDAGSFNADATGAVGPFEPWKIRLGEECLAGATDVDEEAARARARLEAQTDYLLERTFWSGDVDASDFAALGWANRALADPASDILTATGPVGVVTAFSRAIDYLADTIGGLRGMIHVAPILAPYLSFYGVVVRDGFRTLTALADHVVVIGSGYLGTADDGSPAGDGTTWIYVTSMVRTAVSEIDVQADIDRSTNIVTANASRLVLAEWDLQAHAAIQVCLPDPGPSCLETPS